MWLDADELADLLTPNSDERRMFPAVSEVSSNIRWRGAMHSPLHPLHGGALSVQAISWVLDHSKSRLGARHVLISIANHARKDGTGAWPSVQTIARESNLSVREVRYALIELEKIGELSYRKAAGPHGTNLYSLPLCGVQSLQGSGCKIEPIGVQSTAQWGEQFAPEPSLKKSVSKDREGSFAATGTQTSRGVIETLGVQELQGLKTTLVRSLRRRNLPGYIRDSFTGRLQEVESLLERKTA